MPQEQQGTGFTNLSQFLNANQNNNLGNAVTSNLNNQVSGINNNLNSLYSNFQNSANQNALGTEAQQTANTGALNQILGGSTSVSTTQANQFQQDLGGQYQGPTSLNPGAVSQLSTKAGNLSGELNNINNTAGLQNLLTSTITQPNYTQGEQTLDATLLGQNQKALQQSKASAAGLGQAIQQKQNASQAIGQQNVNQAQDYAQQLNNQFSGASTSIDSAVQAQVSADQAQQAQGLGQLFNTYNNQEVSNANTNALLGLTNGAAPNVYGLNANNLAQYVSNIPINTGNAVTPQQIAQYNALAQLGGKNITDVTQVPTTNATSLQPGQLFQLNPSQAQQQLGVAQSQLSDLNNQVSAVVNSTPPPVQSGDNGGGFSTNTTQTFGSLHPNFLSTLNNQAQLASQVNNANLQTQDQAQASQQQLAQTTAANNALFGGAAGTSAVDKLSVLPGLQGLPNQLAQSSGSPQQQAAILQAALQNPGLTNYEQSQLNADIAALQQIVGNTGTQSTTTPGTVAKNSVVKAL